MAKRANTSLVGLVSLYVSLDGRIRRSEYWLGGVALNFLQLVVTLIAAGIVGIASPRAQVAVTAVKVLFLWPGFALMVKRGHDRGRSALFSAGILGALFVASMLMEPATTLYGQVARWTCAIVGLLLVGFMFVDYGFIDGDRGRNRFGPSPKNPDVGRPLSFDDDALPGGSASA